MVGRPTSGQEAAEVDHTPETGTSFRMTTGRRVSKGGRKFESDTETFRFEPGLLFPTFNPLPPSMVPFTFGMRSACAWLRGGR
jgi:hypothetical protein